MPVRLLAALRSVIFDASDRAASALTRNRGGAGREQALTNAVAVLGALRAAVMEAGG